MSKSFKGKLEKMTWQQVRGSVKNVNPVMAKLIDELDPDENHWFAKTAYPYGGHVMKKGKLILPNEQGKLVPIGDSSLSDTINNGLSYNWNSNPVSLVLHNSFEIFLPLEDRTLPLSGLIKPGTAFGAWRILNPQHSEHPVFIWDMTAGARTAFMLPKITNAQRHRKLEKMFGINVDIPRTLMQHWDVFRLLANNNITDKADWSAEILYFSGDWFTHLDDPAWAKFYQYFHNAAWGGSEFWRNQRVWNLIFSLILRDYEGKLSAYSMETAQYLLNIGVGGSPGLGAVCDTVAGPFDLIQAIYQDIYKLDNYPPIIMQPQIFDMRNNLSNPVYYSLRFPNAIEFKPNSRTRTSIISDLHEIRLLLNRYARDLSAEKFNIAETSMYQLFKLAEYDYFHSGVELHAGMLPSEKMAEDVTLRTTVDGKVHPHFPDSCLFSKGCIRLKHREEI